MPPKPISQSLVAAAFYLALLAASTIDMSIQMHAFWLFLVMVPLVIWFSQGRSAVPGQARVDREAVAAGSATSATQAMHAAAEASELALTEELRRLREIGDDIAGQVSQLTIDRLTGDASPSTGNDGRPGDED
ncbi:MAG: hypothetical protein CSB44_06390 [Gammaproteobacteria bacterium]|nr:MAG: hypothetical protein CSB44_06390 [Gammaproteobacteria bacterium]